jgi:hypothetical protein
MATSTPSQRLSLLELPRELRDEIFSHLALPETVYTSGDKPNTTSVTNPQAQAKTFIDTRIYLPCGVRPNVLAVCRQLREECLQHHNRTLTSLPSTLPTAQDQETDLHAILSSNPDPFSNDRKEDEIEEEFERLGDHSLRFTLLVQKPQRGRFGYAVPAREELSPRFMKLLPLMDRAKKLRLVIWPGFDWWNGSRPRSFIKVNGRMKIDEEAPPQPDAVSVAIGKVLERLPAVEELEVDVVAHVSEFSKWDLPDLAWTNIQYWLDGPIVRGAGKKLNKVNRRLAGVWGAKLVEAFYEQQETRLDEGNTWHVKRHGEKETASQGFVIVLVGVANFSQPMMKFLADPAELEEMQETIDEEFDRID